MILGSYVPEDPSWLSATDEPARNLLGRFGASIASPLFIIVGWGAWGLVLVFLVWGVRLVGHIGSDRALTRVIFAPIAIALASVYASTHVPTSEWTHSFGLGGLFGDTVLGAILGVVPVSAVFGIKVMALIVAFGAIGMALFVLGFTVQEIRKFARFMGVGFILAYANLMQLLGRGAAGAAQGVGAMRARQAKRAAKRRAKAQDAHLQATSELVPQSEYVNDDRSFFARKPLVAQRGETPEPVSKPGLRLRMPSLIRRPTLPEAELVEPEFHAHMPTLEEGDDRIKAKIADVIKSRVRQKVPVQALRAEPPVVGRLRGPKPMILAQAASQAEPLPSVEEPPMVAERASFVPPAPVEPLVADPMFEVEPETYVAPRAAVEDEPRAVVQHGTRKPPTPSRKARAEAQPRLQFEEKHAEYEHPPLSLLTSPVEVQRHHLSDEALEAECADAGIGAG